MVLGILLTQVELYLKGIGKMEFLGTLGSEEALEDIRKWAVTPNKN